MDHNAVVLDGTGLSCAQVRSVARVGARVTVADDGVHRAERAWRTAREVADEQSVYGRTTGVGANRLVDVDWDDGDTHGLRLLRSHAAGAGPMSSAELARAMITVRVNQLASGGSGVDPGVLGALTDTLNRGFVPPVPTYGAIGTGDLTALASTALCLLGERQWLGGGASAAARPPRFPLRSADALAFISSNAATLGESAVATCDLRELLEASIVVAALSLVAVDGSAEPYAVAVHRATPHPGQDAVAARMRALLAKERLAGARIQDPFGYRAFPQVHGPAVDTAAAAEQVIERELNAAAENPLVDVDDHTVWHNGNFHTAYVGLALDAARAALFQTAALSAARLGTLVEPRFTGMRPFLAAGPESSSGVMILEYVAHSAIADLRRYAAPAALGSAVLSRGMEEHAGFSPQSARGTTDASAAYRVALACELIAAVRTLRMRGLVPEGPPLQEAFAAASERLDPRPEDRPFDDDLAAAQQLLPDLAAIPRSWGEDQGSGSALQQG